MRCIDVFAGIGGMHLAAAAAGFECVWACEADAGCRDVYLDNHGLLPAPDIAGVPVDAVPDHELCLAGLPCQSYSVAGLGRGLDDGRAHVLLGLLKILQAKRPQVCLLENVPGLVTQGGGQAFNLIRQCLRSFGYRVDWRIVAATEFGGATLRRRVFIVGSRIGRFDFDRLERRPARRLADILGHDGGECWLRAEQYTLLDRPRPARSGLVFAGYLNNARRYPERNPACSTNHRQQNRVYAACGIGPTISSQDATARYWVAVEGRVRKLTRAELVRMQGFPEDFRWPRSQAMVRQLGNSVHVPTVRAVCQGIADQLLGGCPRRRQEKATA